MHIAIAHSLEVTNSRSRHRVLEVRLEQVPAGIPGSEHVTEIRDSFERLELPPHLKRAVRSVPDDEPARSGWAALVAWVAVRLQCAVGQPSFQGFPRDADCLEHTIALECLEFEVARAAVEAAATMVSDVAATGQGNILASFEIVRAADEQYSLGDATGPIIAAARDRGLPVQRLDAESHVQVGEGRWGRRIRKAVTDSTSLLAEQVSTDKAYTKQLWMRIGIPCPAGRVVSDATDAVRAARELGWPVVVKPLDSDYSRGVTLNVVDPAGVRAAFRAAQKEGSSVLVEKNVVGSLHRFLVVDDHVVSAVRRDPAGVIGDGVQSIRELVEAENRSPRRGPDYRWPLQRLHLEGEEQACLGEQGFGPHSVLQKGQRVALRREPFLTSGGETHEVLDDVHPSTIAAVLDAVRVIGLDIAGVDLIARDISLPLDQQNGGLLELNAQPAICLHLAPFNDQPQPVGEAILRSLFPRGATGRIPLAIVVGNFVEPGELRPLTRAMSIHDRYLAISTPRVTQLRNRRLSPASTCSADRLSAIRLHPRTAAACVSVTVSSIVERGLGTDHCRLLVLANTERLPPDPGCSKTEIRKLLPQLLATAEICLVNADDPVWSELIRPGAPNVVIAAENSSHPLVRAHLQCGGRVAVVEDQHVVIRSADRVDARRPVPVPAGDFPGDWQLTSAAMLLELTSFRHVRRDYRVGKGGTESRTGSSSIAGIGGMAESG